MGFIFVIAGIVAALIHLAVRRPAGRAELVDIFLLHSLIFNVGFVGVFFGFIPHVFYADFAAEQIGWQTGSHFQYEVGFHDGAWGILGFLCIRFRDRFWLATGLGWSFFMIGAAWGHLLDTINNANYAHNNFFMIFVDALIAAILLGLLALRYWWVPRRA